MKELIPKNKPIEEPEEGVIDDTVYGPLYWVARNDDGTVIHSGVTEIGQVTTTGQKNLIFGDEAKQIKELEKYAGKKPSKDYIFDSVERKWIKETP